MRPGNNDVYCFQSGFKEVLSALLGLFNVLLNAFILSFIM
jgi:hypothetical protein